MLVERSMHPDWLSNAYVLAIEGGPAVFVDSGADIAPLTGAVERWRATPVALLRTHAHGDHVEHEDRLVQRYSIPAAAEPRARGGEGLRGGGLGAPGYAGARPPRRL